MALTQSLTQSVWFDHQKACLCVVDQSALPFEEVVLEISTCARAAEVIENMNIRGAPLIGIVGAYGLAFALRDGASAESASDRLKQTRPTAVNLAWALARTQNESGGDPMRALEAAHAILKEDAELCTAIGQHGLEILRECAARTSGPVNILTHCNAGWLATAKYGTALAPMYLAQEAGLEVHVWVDETRPRNQGARLTAWELQQAGVPHTVIVDNAGGHLMQQGQVDVCFVGSDRVARNGDVCNKIGTYLKALAARDNDVPFYALFPFSTIDFSLASGRDIPIEARDGEEVRSVFSSRGRATVVSPGSAVRNDAFDVTPARLLTGWITERGVARTEHTTLEAVYSGSGFTPG